MDAASDPYLPYDGGGDCIPLRELHKRVLVVKNPPAMQETQEMQVRSLHRKDALEEEMEAHSSILAWRIPWTEEPGGLQSMGSQRVGHD